jgi:hypothetical protein
MSQPLAPGCCRSAVLFLGLCLPDAPARALPLRRRLQGLAVHSNGAAARARHPATPHVACCSIMQRGAARLQLSASSIRECDDCEHGVAIVRRHSLQYVSEGAARARCLFPPSMRTNTHAHGPADGRPSRRHFRAIRMQVLRPCARVRARAGAGDPARGPGADPSVCAAAVLGQTR